MSLGSLCRLEVYVAWKSGRKQQPPLTDDAPLLRLLRHAGKAGPAIAGNFPFQRHVEAEGPAKLEDCADRSHMGKVAPQLRVIDVTADAPLA